MYETIAEIKALFGEEVESIWLEFKSGRMFDNMIDGVRRELVKDVTAFANAGGGTIIIGVAEGRDGTRNVATGFELVMNNRITVDQLTNIVKSNCDPVFAAFRIRSLPHESGRVFVIEIDQADTAHQNRMDQRYYQRTGAISEPMFDFAIRDVMNRRTRPRLSVALSRNILSQEANRHVYRITPVLFNEGFLTVKHWALWIDLPRAVSDLEPLMLDQVQVHENPVQHNGYAYTRCDFFDTPESRILPGQRQVYSVENGFLELDLRVDHRIARGLVRHQPPLRWTLFVDNGPRQDGSVPFAEWCSF